ncbi:RhoGAP domain containing protein [Metarhizium album ARSEF 1941]|uniref:RhoGAP domain containing protein n=1 Tax=Metarhizium album (strain ARSEF 1941) TaxID=1081103 RepID=A0A0B2WJX1_METAS|nr:RhoGAP domain containing protein [Metarhizium album ARSEF 1941]KHN96336.1 RhoGAP domain containing protein [Metarhizium album ARSEF 1941]
MGRRPTPQPLPLGLASTKANTSANANPDNTHSRSLRLGATGAVATATATAPAAAAAASAAAAAAATGFGLQATVQATGSGTATCNDSTAETAVQAAKALPGHPASSPVSTQSSLSLSLPSLQSQPSLQSPQPEPSHSQSHSRSQPSVSLTSRFAAAKRRQTSQTPTARGHLQTPACESNRLRRPPQLQLQPGQSAQYHDQNPASPSLAVRHADGGKRPSTRSGFFHSDKSFNSSNQVVHDSRPQFSHSREHLAARGPQEPRAPKSANFPYAQEYLQKPPLPSRSELSLSSAGDCDGTSALSPGGKRTKTKSFGLLSRSKSHRDKDRNHSSNGPVLVPATPSRDEYHDDAVPPRTAPVAQDRAFRDMMNSGARNRSEDRAARRDSSRDKERGALPSSLKENNSGFFSGLRSSSTRAADIISKGLFGKGSRSGSTAEREHAVDDEHYVLKVLNLPLVEQTRITRISKRLESSRDKTEFWMPAFPWRAIDYLNYNGCDVEGLYRVPGSGAQIKKWQRKFDEKYDVNLFEDDDLYDINIIGSMLKAWLRELPDELFPKAAQDRIARECAGATEVPQLLIEELSNLSPFNYYLLFAITCHLSLLLSHSDKNKMDFRNLCICFQPCMKIDAFCFKFLVCDWRDCWIGCKNEAKFIEEEYRLFDQPPPRGITKPNGPSHGVEHNDRQPSSTDSNKPSDYGHSSRALQRQFSGSNASIGSRISSISTNFTTNSEREPQETTRQLRPLSPIKPLSPIGF